MDRFIVRFRFQSLSSSQYLKSNMDRFIDKTTTITVLNRKDLKSNMDRFIACSFKEKLQNLKFKIQYG